jgi:hypothetical protein
MKGKDLLIVGAAVFVLYKLAQVQPQAEQSGGQYLTNMPVLDTPSAATGGGDINLIDARDIINPVNNNLWSYGNPVNGGDPFRAMREQFIGWVDGIPVGISPDDPRLRPAVIDVSGMV